MYADCSSPDSVMFDIDKESPDSSDVKLRFVCENREEVEKVIAVLFDKYLMLCWRESEDGRMFSNTNASQLATKIGTQHRCHPLKLRTFSSGLLDFDRRTKTVYLPIQVEISDALLHFLGELERDLSKFVFDSHSIPSSDPWHSFDIRPSTVFGPQET